MSDPARLPLAVDPGVWRPRLRAGVALVQEAQRAVLRDEGLGRVVPAGVVGQALAVRLDGTRALPDLLGEAAAAAGVARGEAESVLRSLLLMSMIEGAGDALVARARAAMRAAPQGLETLPEGRFGCAGSGQCCRVYRPGPLSLEDERRLAAAAPALRAAFPDLEPEPWVEERVTSEGTRRYLRRTDEGSCVFLRPDRRCGVHAAAGVEAKPDICRLFPFDLVRTIEGTRVFDRSQCSSFASTAAQGERHAAHAAELSRLAAVAEPRLFHPLTLVGEGLPCDYGHVLSLERRLLAATAPAELDAAGRLRAVGAVARAFVAALEGCPIAPGEPEASLAEALRAPPALPVPAPDQAAWTLAAVTEGLERSTEVEDEPGAPLVLAFRDVLATARSLAAERAGLAEGPLPEVVRAASALPLDAALADATLRASLRNRLFGGRLLVEGHLRAGLLRLALVHWLTYVGARLRAAASGRRAVGAEELSAGHWIVSLALARPSIARALLPLQGETWSALAAIPTLLG